jgi:hypothetical protein
MKRQYGTVLWPEFIKRLYSSPRHGTLIVTRDRLDRHRKIYLPWKADYFRHRVAEIRTAADFIRSQFMGLRHGGSTESGNADLTDSQIRALSGHNTPAMTTLYTKQTSPPGWENSGIGSGADACAKKF